MDWLQSIPRPNLLRPSLAQAVLDLERQATQLQVDYTNRDGIRRQVTDVVEYACGLHPFTHPGTLD